MRTTKLLFGAFLIITITLSGFPGFLPEDVNRDGEVSLKDVILSLKEVAFSVEHTELFTPSFRNTLSAITTAAGLKLSLISKQKETKVFSISSVFLVSLHKPFALNKIVAKIPDIELLGHRTFYSLPPDPPPELV